MVGLNAGCGVVGLNAGCGVVGLNAGCGVLNSCEVAGVKGDGGCCWCCC